MTTVKATSHRAGSSGRGGKIALGVLLGIVAIALALYLADLAMHRGNVPRGTTVGGVNIGAMKPDEAREKLEGELGGIADEPVEIRAGDKTATFIPAKSGLDIDWQATVDAAGIETANPVSRLRGLFTTREVDAVARIDEPALKRQLDRLVGELHVDLSLIHI